ncbi:hypothetical protein ACFCV8_05355 [Streptomyces sp. NPDC056347]
MHQEDKELLYAVPPLLLQRMADAGHLGRKTGGDRLCAAHKRIRVLRTA